MKTIKLAAILLLPTIAMLAVSAVHAQPPASPTPPTWEGLRCDELWTKAIAESKLSAEELSGLPDWTKDEDARFTSCLHVNRPGGPTLSTTRWCPEVPETPSPPGFDVVPRAWAQQTRVCSSLDPSRFRSLAAYDSQAKMCGEMCGYAIGRWGALSNPRPKMLNQLTPEPVPGATPTPLFAPPAPQSATDPGGPLTPGGYFAGADLSAIIDGGPPDVAADVSPTQNVEFVNSQGMFIWSKPTLPIKSPPTPSTISLANFWCGGNSNAINGQTASQCSGGQTPSGYMVGDTQVGYDPSIARWVATTLISQPPPKPPATTRPANAPPDFVWVAVSSTGTALADSTTWTKWSVPVCTDNAGSPKADQPLLGWSGQDASRGVVGVDVVCFNAADTMFNEDNLVVVPTSMLLQTPAPALPNPIVPPCLKMTPVRDESQVHDTTLFLLAPIVPGDKNVIEPGTCGSFSGNNPNITTPYVVEYTATGTGSTTTVTGSSVCKAGVACTPRSQSVPRGNLGLFKAGAAAQLDCKDPTCMIDANDARIKAAQIRSARDSSGITSRVLTLGFSTGYQSATMTGSQALWFFQSPSDNRWLSTSLIGNGFWFSYPTTAIDDDFDLYLGSTWFTAGTRPSMVWDLFSSSSFGNFTLEGQDVIERSTQEYTGDGTSMPQRWGDYNTMIYDPNAIVPGGEPVFWQVEEVTCSSQSTTACVNGEDDESTSWVALTDPPPLFFVGPPVTAETEPPSNAMCSAPYSLTTSVSPPSGVQAGDVLIAILRAGDPTLSTSPTLPAGWTLLTMNNVGASGSTTMTSSSTCGLFATSQIAVHAYSASDTLPYSFSFQITPVADTCISNACFLGESQVYLNDYRFAGTDFTKYTAFGFPNSDNGSNTTSATTAITIPAASKVLTIFSGVGDAGEPNEFDICETFLQPTGAPALTVESSLTPDCTLPAFLSADVSSVSGGTIGGYTESPMSIKTLGDESLPAWQVVIPEPNQ